MEKSVVVFHVITIFPSAFDSFLRTSLVARGIKRKIIAVNLINLRDYATNKHKSVDDRPFGGGPGMVLRVDIIDSAISNIKYQISKKNKSRIILLEPAGKPFAQKDAKRLAKYDELVLVAGHYEGIDERVRDLVDEEISIGDYVLTGGELPAMVIIDAVARMVPGFLGKEESGTEESFSIRHSGLGNLLEYPQYTRPEVYKGQKVPKVLLSGDHAKIKEWRHGRAFKRTKKRRPDLLENRA